MTRRLWTTSAGYAAAKPVMSQMANNLFQKKLSLIKEVYLRITNSVAPKYDIFNVAKAMKYTRQVMYAMS